MFSFLSSEALAEGIRSALLGNRHFPEQEKNEDVISVIGRFLDSKESAAHSDVIQGAIVKLFSRYLSPDFDMTHRRHIALLGLRHASTPLVLDVYELLHRASKLPAVHQLIGGCSDLLFDIIVSKVQYGQIRARAIELIDHEIYAHHSLKLFYAIAKKSPEDLSIIFPTVCAYLSQVNHDNHVVYFDKSFTLMDIKNMLSSLKADSQVEFIINDLIAPSKRFSVEGAANILSSKSVEYEIVEYRVYDNKIADKNVYITPANQRGVSQALIRYSRRPIENEKEPTFNLLPTAAFPIAKNDNLSSGPEVLIKDQFSNLPKE